MYQGNKVHCIVISETMPCCMQIYHDKAAAYQVWRFAIKMRGVNDVVHQGNLLPYINASAIPNHDLSPHVRHLLQTDQALSRQDTNSCNRDVNDSAPRSHYHNCWPEPWSLSLYKH